MNRFFKVLVLSALVGITLAFAAACSSTGSSPESSVAATVNGKKIMLAEIERIVHQQSQGKEAQLSAHDLAQARLSVLDSLIQRELQKIVVDCFPMLEHEYRTVLKMRVDGLTYGEIAGQLGVNENTVATWVTRGIRTLAQRVRNRIECFTARRRP